MVINAAGLARILQPGFRQVFGGMSQTWGAVFEEPPLFISAEWKAQYEIEYRKAMNKRGWEVWLSKHTPAVRERLERLNPNGVEPGNVPRGWRPENRNFRFTEDLTPNHEYIKKWGAPPGNSWRRGPRKKYITRAAYIDGCAHRGGSRGSS